MNRLPVISLIFSVLFAGSCSLSLDEGRFEDGVLDITLANVSAEVSSKSTPVQLDKPAVGNFRIKVVRNSNGAVILDRLYSDECRKVKVASGEPYTVYAEAGENPVLAFDTPYYTGAVEAVVEKGQTKNVAIPCKVANALVSVRFGSTETDSLRFTKYFDRYALTVTSGGYMMELPATAADLSIYLRADAAFSLGFSGYLKSTGEKRMFQLHSDKIPTSLSAAEHLIVTLDIKAESGVDVTVSKAEIDNVELQQAIPYEWLPMPEFHVNHVFGDGGVLLGTNLSCDESYPGCTWTARVKNSDGVEVRTLKGEGALLSQYTESPEWPYLPSGTYSASFSYNYGGATVPVEGRKRTFTVPSPQGITASLSCYTSYDKYLQGGVSEANSCEAFTLYGIELTPAVSETLRSNSRYASLISATSGDVAIDGKVVAAIKSLKAGNVGNVDPGAHKCSVAFSFDGASGTAEHSFRITGLPVRFSPPTEGAGWKKGDGTVSWESSEVKLGQWAWSQPHYIQYDKFSIPMGTKITASYDVMPSAAAISTTITLTLGSYTYCSVTAKSYKDNRESGSQTFIVGSDVTSAKANNSYGSGATCGYVYSLSYEYAQ